MTAIGNPLWVQALTYAAADDRTILRFLINTQGVGSPTSLAVTQNGTPNMSVNVAAGQAAIFRTSSSPSDFYVVESPNTSTNLTIAASDPTNPRIDLIIARVNDAQYSGGTNNATVEVVTGTPAASPVAPTQPNTSLLLATVAVAANATTIVNANITDNRVNWTTQRPANSNIVYTSSGTLTAAQCAGAKTLRVRCVGGGGGGGGAATCNGSQGARGSGGGGGGYAESLLGIGGISFPVTITVGAGGSGGAAGANNGTAGGDSSFGATVIAKGGAAGGGGAAVAVGSVSVAGTAVVTGNTGQITMDGGTAMPGFVLGLTALIGGKAGSSAMGGAGQYENTGNATAAGRNATANQGGGGGGACVVASGTQQAGGTGGSGLVIVELIY